MDLHLHDIVELKKAHPCGANRWEILRVGMDIRLRCCGCGHDLMLPRSKIEKSIRKILEKEELPEVKLKEFVGHTPIQVLAGIFVGVVNSLILYNIIL